MINRVESLFCYVLLATILSLMFSGCSHQTPGPKTRETAPIPGYLGLQEEFGPQDFSPLRARRIVLDPGHGGFFKGALGPNGLTEAEVNLGVALYLRGLLEWAGAEVHLTRTADYDFLSPADSTLATDLSFRSSFMDSLQPDVFISIHHNSTASRDPEVNETQTYYPLGDQGASVDLARSIHRHLVLNLEITPAKILPGNFHVLRQATVPAVLGEPAMISNPVMEGRLSLASSQELEAKAYFLGLLDYFSNGQPRWSGATSDTISWASGEQASEITWVFLSSEPGELAGPSPRPASFRLTLDGTDQGFDLSADGHTLTWRPDQDLSPGEHLLHLKGQNLAGRATPDRWTRLRVTGQNTLIVRLFKESATYGNDAKTMVRWQTPQSDHHMGGYLDLGPQLSLPIPPIEQGWFLVPSHQVDPAKMTYRVGDQSTQGTVQIESGSELPEGYHWRLIKPSQAAEATSLSTPELGWHHRLPRNFAFEPKNCPPLGPAVVWESDQPVWIEGKGALPLVDPGPGGQDRPRTLDADSHIWSPQWLLPQLHGRTVVLDPAGGGTNTDGTYMLGTRGSDINLATALQARDLLEGAGARVLMTRQAEVAPDAQQKVLLAGDSQADLFLTIGRISSGDQMRALHHPGSRMGVRWAQAMSEAMAPLDSLQVGQSYAYLLRHTACPALEIRLRAPLSAAEEILVSSLPWQMAEARAILLACAAVFSEDGSLPINKDPEQLIQNLPGGLPWASLDWARWDGNFSWQPASSQKSDHPITSWSTPGWPTGPGVHTLEVHAAEHWQLWQVEFMNSGPKYRLMMENR